jgi:hypothetical protein
LRSEIVRRIALKVKPFMVVAGLGTSIGTFALGTIFQGLLLPKVIGNGGGLLAEVLNASSFGIWAFYLSCFAACVLAALVLGDISNAVLSFFPAYLLGALVTYLGLIVPALTGTYPDPSVLEESATIFTFTAFFPLLLLDGLAGTIIGGFLSERIL